MINIPERQWIALQLPKGLCVAPGDGHTADLQAGQKHVMGGENPLNGRTYWTGGDYNGQGSPGSYRQFTFSLDLGERLADKANPQAGWRVVHGECSGTDQNPQPKHPDFTAWQWDENRRGFWMMPGVMEATSSYNCPGETADKVDNPAYLHSFIMFFDPATNKWSKSWTATGPRGFPATSWWAFYDPVKDTLNRAIYWNTTALDIVDCKTGIYTNPPKILGKNALGVDWIANHKYWATDYAMRQTYCFAGDNRLHRINMDTLTATDLGPQPAGDSSGEQKIVWDSVNNVLIYHAYPFGWWVYDKGVWTELPNVADNGVKACGRAMCFSKADNCVMSWGLNDSDPALSPSMPFLFLFRYAKPSGTVIQVAKSITLSVVMPSQQQERRKPLP